MIRDYRDTDWPSLWPLLHEVFRTGDTYAVDPAISEVQARAYWTQTPLKTLVFEGEGGGLLGTYYLKTNQPGPGSHVCNCGYIVAPAARGQGLATTLCRHSLDLARDLGYRAMQYNFVASTNSGAVRLWESLGFAIVGTLPGAFCHPQQGDVDAYVMFQTL
ncbi:MAG: GNAT family N-acetyltransferase [Natronospirillum sp.]|uniref:GNAT family N-acetyltransferase n=1 Tax=Natronospirillum sp. TaxID=2812955 RepID=UPI0025F6D108|nr:N-acetyltransferase [Natronospirillum sp.]MCH8550619.1 GNAT family N-acetyltransferase [Natronospirillum sp.]